MAIYINTIYDFIDYFCMGGKHEGEDFTGEEIYIESDLDFNDIPDEDLEYSKYKTGYQAASLLNPILVEGNNHIIKNIKNINQPLDNKPSGYDYYFNGVINTYNNYTSHLTLTIQNITVQNLTVIMDKSCLGFIDDNMGTNETIINNCHVINGYINAPLVIAFGRSRRLVRDCSFSGIVTCSNFHFILQGVTNRHDPYDTANYNIISQTYFEGIILLNQYNEYPIQPREEYKHINLISDGSDFLINCYFKGEIYYTGEDDLETKEDGNKIASNILDISLGLDTITKYINSYIIIKSIDYFKEPQIRIPTIIAAKNKKPSTLMTLDDDGTYKYKNGVYELDSLKTPIPWLEKGFDV